MTAILKSIYRYPVKGLSAEPLDAAPLTPGETLLHDRRFAIAHGTTKFDVAAPQWLPKQNYIMLAKDEKLAQLETRFDPESEMLTILRNGKQVVRAKATDIMGKTLIGQFFAGYMGSAGRGTPRLVEAAGHSFSDVPEKVLSLINLASIRDLERVLRQEVHPLRFRGNLYLEGLDPWEEMTWIGREVTIGTARLQIMEPIQRCAATNVNPLTAERDMNIPLTLRKGFRHMQMGVYAKVVAAGEIAKSDSLVLIEG